jgi:hypothetical protein
VARQNHPQGAHRAPRRGEEGEIFKAERQTFGKSELEEIGRRFEELKEQEMAR